MFTDNRSLRERISQINVFSLPPVEVTVDKNLSWDENLLKIWADKTDQEIIDHRSKYAPLPGPVRSGLDRVLELRQSQERLAA